MCVSVRVSASMGNDKLIVHVDANATSADVMVHVHVVTRATTMNGEEENTEVFA